MYWHFLPVPANRAIIYRVNIFNEKLIVFPYTYIKVQSLPKQ